MKDIKCSFCNKDRNQVEQMIEGPKIGNSVLYICNECIDISHETLHSEDNTETPPKMLIPEKIKEKLDEHIIGQDDAKIAVSVAVYNHYKRIYGKKIKTKIDKSNILMIGESGTGKTLIVKTIAQMFDLPYIIADATTLTETGYVGGDAESLVLRLVQSAGDDVERAAKGIIFIDEIDKKSKKNEMSTVSRDVSGEGVQQALLKLIEGTTVQITNGFGETFEFDTSNILFILSGSFTGLAKQIANDRNKATIGFQSTSITPLEIQLKSVTSDDLIKFGLIPEFVGRCPITVVLDNMTEEMLLKILVEPKHSLVNQFKALFSYENVVLEFNPKYLERIAGQCIKQKIGARGLRSIIEKDLQPIQYILPTLSRAGVINIIVNEDGTTKNTYKVKKVKALKV